MNSNAVKLNLGSGNSKWGKDNGYINIDIENFEYVDIVHDIEKTLPFKNETVDEIFCRHALEHCSMASVPKMLKDWYLKISLKILTSMDRNNKIYQ